MRERALPMLCGSRSRRSAGDGHVAVLAESAPALRPSDEHEPAGEAATDLAAGHLCDAAVGSLLKLACTTGGDASVGARRSTVIIDRREERPRPDRCAGVDGALDGPAARAGGAVEANQKLSSLAATDCGQELTIRGRGRDGALSSGVPAMDSGQMAARAAMAPSRARRLARSRREVETGGARHAAAMIAELV